MWLRVVSMLLIACGPMVAYAVILVGIMYGLGVVLVMVYMILYDVFRVGYTSNICVSNTTIITSYYM